MATFRRFFQDRELCGNVRGMANAEFAQRFPGIKGRRFDSFSMRVMADETGALWPVEREIEFKANPSRHECDARCFNATGKIMRCECSCGGKNHGLGAFRCVEA